VKTARHSLDRVQLVEHLKNLDDEGTQERLFVVTPDAAQPPVLNDLRDPRVIWFNFATLSDAIDAALADPATAPAEQARFLLREFRALLVEDGLIDNDDVVIIIIIIIIIIVAARAAYPSYLAHHAYVCQSGRSFRDGLTHLGFYGEKAIQPVPARILHREASVPFTPEEAVRRRGTDGPHDHQVAEVIDALLARGGVDDEPALHEPGSSFETRVDRHRTTR